MARDRIQHPCPPNLGEPQSVRDAYDGLTADQAQADAEAEPELGM